MQAQQDTDLAVNDVAGKKDVQRTVSWSLIIGAIIVAFVIFMALLSFVWTPHDPTLVEVSDRLLGPNGTYWFGTDRYGRDIFSQILVGSRITLFVGIVAVGVAALVGVPLGIVSTITPHWLGETLMRVNDIMLAFPALLLAIMLTAVYGQSTFFAMLAIGIATIPNFARLTRSGALQVVQTEYVLAAEIAGTSRAKIGWRHVLPNVTNLIIVQTSVSFAIAILAEAALSYLGLGTPPPIPSWGRMLHESQQFLYTEPRLIVFPAAAIIITVLGFNLLGDGLRDYLDPRMETRQ